MSSEPLLQFESLLTPIPGDHPAGDTVPFTVRQKLEEFRKEVNPAEFAEDDPLRPAEIKRANWSGIIELTSQTLRETSKDLLVAARLTEALTKEHGFAGARDGFHLLRLLVETCWDRLNPAIEDGDVEVRATAFNWLDDPDRGARYPTAVRTVPLVTREDEEFGWVHWKQIQEGRGNLKLEDFDRAVQATPRERCQRTVEEIAAALKEQDELVNALTAKMEALAPGLLEIKKALVDCQTLAQQILQRKGPAPVAVVEQAPVAAAGGDQALVPVTQTAPTPGYSRPMRTRDDVYRQLAEAAAVLQQVEPHSPIPYLIQRAVALGALPFPRLMRELIRDANILAEMNRQLGIKDEDEEEESATNNEER